MLTKKRKEVLDYITKFTNKNGYAPSLEEISRGLKLKSASTAHFHVHNLEKDGYITKKVNSSRSISLDASRTGEQQAVNLPNNKIILGDALQEMKKLPSELYDIIIIDPPYNIGKDFGNNTDKRELQEYIQWSREWLDESVRLLKPGGTMFVYGFSEILAYLSVELSLPKRWLIWHYTNKNVASLNFWQRSHEAIICAWKGKPRYNRDAVREPYTESFLKNAAGKPRKNTIGRFSKGEKATVYTAHEGGALPRDVIKTPALAGGAGMSERWFVCRDCEDVYEPRALKQHRDHDIMKHPTQKPLNLTRKLLLSAVPESGGSVLVPFAGTGSELVVAKELGMDYLGIELNPEYIQLANKWLEAAPPRLL
jgi:site-specific DNA-methyltransferase (adenine-specific)